LGLRFSQYEQNKNISWRRWGRRFISNQEGVHDRICSAPAEAEEN